MSLWPDLFAALVLGALAAPVIDRLAEWLPRRILEEEQRWSGGHPADSAEPLADAPVWRWPPDRTSWAVLAASIGVVALLLPMLGWGPRLGVFLLFGWTLVTLAAADARTQLLPDALTLPLVWAGLLIQLSPATRTAGPEMAIVGAVCGYLPLRLIGEAFYRLRGVDGLGFGDMKLLAAIGAWLGPLALPPVVVLSSLAGIVWQGARLLLGRSTAGAHFAFGPWIIAATLTLFPWLL